jgi:hypothetical protein
VTTSSLVLTFGSVALHLSVLATAIYGIVLSFNASIILGIASLIVSPMGLVIGGTKLLAGIDLAQRIATALGV